MPRKILLRLTEEHRRMLMATAQKDINWRVRERAQTVLHFDAGHSAEAVAELMGLHVRTVSSTRTAWLAQGFASLPDLARVGAPEKLPAAQPSKLVDWDRSQPVSAQDLQKQTRE